MGGYFPGYGAAGYPAAVAAQIAAAQQSSQVRRQSLKTIDSQMYQIDLLICMLSLVKFVFINGLRPT